jgi:hypothetical protein
MKNDDRTDIAVIAVCVLVATLAIALPLIRVGTAAQAVAVFGGVLLGPGGLAYRWATGRPWSECLAIGAAINVASVMLLSLLLVSAHFWHPLPFELLIPLATWALSAAFLRRRMSGSPTMGE